jgi:mRNA interferase RelE/StbE
LAYDIEYDPKAFKQLQKLNPTIANDILDGIEEFANTPVITKIKKLKTPFDGAYRLRIGDCRATVYQENNLMLISKIAYRKEVY